MIPSDYFERRKLDLATGGEIARMKMEIMDAADSIFAYGNIDSNSETYLDSILALIMQIGGEGQSYLLTVMEDADKCHGGINNNYDYVFNSARDLDVQGFKRTNEIRHNGQIARKCIAIMDAVALIANPENLCSETGSYLAKILALVEKIKQERKPVVDRVIAKAREQMKKNV